MDEQEIKSICQDLQSVLEGIDNLAEHSVYDMRKDAEELSFLVQSSINKLQSYVDMQSRCRNCVYLMGNEDGKWYCDSAGKYCIDIPLGKCPEHVDESNSEGIE